MICKQAEINAIRVDVEAFKLCENTRRDNSYRIVTAMQCDTLAMIMPAKISACRGDAPSARKTMTVSQLEDVIVEVPYHHPHKP